MKLPNWFKIVWWLTLFIGTGFLLYQRYSDIASGKANSVDIFILAIWLALALTPIFQEISLLGITFKQQLEELKKEVKEELVNIRTSISNSIDIRQHFYPLPPSDTQLPAIEEQIKSVIGTIYGLEPKKSKQKIQVDDNILFLFSARYSLEKEIRRIWEDKIGSTTEKRPLPFHLLLQELSQYAVIDQQLSRLIREVYSVCSPAIHGEDVSKAKVNFVKDVVPEILTVLKSI